MKLLNLIRGFVLKTNKIKVLNFLYLKIYALPVSILCRVIKRNKCVRSFYISKKLTKSNHIPAISDIDLTLVTANVSAKDEVAFLFFFSRFFKVLKRLFPFLGEVGIGSEEELRLFYSVRLYFNLKKRETLYLLCGENTLKKTNNEIPESLLRLDALFFAVTINFHSNFTEIYMQTDTPNKLSDELLTKINQRILDCCEIAAPSLGKIKNPPMNTPGETLLLLERTCAAFIKNQPQSNASTPALFQNTAKSCTQTLVTEGMKGFFDLFYEKHSSFIQSILLVPACCENYNYRIMVTFSENSSTETINLIAADIQKLYKKERHNPVLRYFKMHHFPLLLTPGMFELYRFSLPRASVEYFNIASQAVTLFGKNTLINSHFNSHYLKEALYSSVSLIPTCIRYILWSDTFRNPQSHATSGLVDYVCGILPMYHLAIKKGIIVTSQRDANIQYQALCPHNQLDWYNDFFNTFSGKSIKAVDQIDIKSLYLPSFSFFKEVFKDLSEENEYQRLIGC